MLGNERARGIEFVASDMWAAFINVVHARSWSAVHVLTAFLSWRAHSRGDVLPLWNPGEAKCR
jgi:hypothetical protein